MSHPNPATPPASSVSPRRPTHRSARIGRSHLVKPGYRQTSVPDILQRTDAVALVWAVRTGDATQQVCPFCGVVAQHYWIDRVRRWKCREKLCRKQFSLFSQTVLHGTRLDPPRLLALLLNFVEAKDSISASEIARQYGLDHKSAYVLLLKVRQALYQSLLDAPPLTGEVQADAAYFCKYRRPGNVGNGASLNGKAAQKNAGLTENGRLRREVSENMHALVVFVSVGQPRRYKLDVIKTETQNAINELAPRCLAPSAVVTTDKHGAYNGLSAMVEEHHQVDHSCEFVGADGAHTNHAESLFARIRQAHAGAWHRLGVQWLAYYAAEMAWRQEMVGQGNLNQLKDLLGRLLKTRPTGRLKDYWRKSEAGKALPAEDADGIIQRVPAAAVPRKRGRPKKSERRI